MPQFRPFRWINYVLWTLILLFTLVGYLHTIYLPLLVKIQRVRNYIYAGF